MNYLKTSILTLTITVVTASCTTPYDGFVLNGKIEGDALEKVYIRYADSTGNRIMDSVLVENGKFTYKGGIKEPTSLILAKIPNIRTSEDPYVNVWIEPTTMSLTLNSTDFKDFTLIGSATNDQEQALNKQKEPIMAAYKPLTKAYSAAATQEEAEKIREQMEPYRDQFGQIDMAFVKEHPDSYITLNIMRYKVSNMTVSEAEEHFNSLSDRLKQSRQGQEIAQEIQNLRNGSVGSPMTSFAKEDINGELFDLATLKGEKCILIDFWASWCAPCRASNPHLKEVYKKYKDKGFEIVCIADDDSSPEKWKNAVKADGIEAFRHVLRGLKRTAEGFDRSNDISDLYGIHSLPTKILIDKEGIIVGRYGGGGEPHEMLDAKLKELFGE